MKITVNELSLLHAARTGDPTALNRVLVLCQPDIRRYAQRHCSVSDVDDAVQEALWILSRKIGSLQALAALSGWLFQVVARECRRLGRKVLRLDPFEEDKMEAWLSVRNTDQLRMELIQTFESLPSDYREIILMRDFEELTIAEIAEELNITVAASKSRLHRARAMAREYLLGSE
jgi:RNA polymerase sigma factor (sigma-70 family)